MADDRRTSIDGDQITDYSIGSDELNTDKQTTARRKYMVLMYKEDVNGQLMWAFPLEGRIFS